MLTSTHPSYPTRLLLSSFLFFLTNSFSSYAWIQIHPTTTRRTSIIRTFSIDQIPDIIQQSFREPEGRAALLNDLAEASNVVILSTEPSTLVLRLGVVMRNVLGLTSDYLPHQSIRPDEVIFNIPIVGASLFLLGKSAVPIVQAQFVELDELDLTAYRLCFAPVGVTLLQFKSMKATGCFDWMECSPGTVLIDENENYRRSHRGHILRRSSETDNDWKYLYWQFDGTVIQSYRGNVFGVVERHGGMHIDNPGAQGLLGDTRFISNLEAEQRAQQWDSASVGDNSVSSIDPLQHPIATMTIGSNGAKMLRIDSYKLFDLMDHDERLESSIRQLLLKSLKLKIVNLLKAYHRDNNANGDENNTVEEGQMKIETKEKPRL
ncbi:hypothetical protein HJC23_009409 [Cyclotella cryptica]|uniref:Uncharacterized protein n=1 Tax=Cyclotella cryptica TaxID=29204 RepID=A0ABD3PZL0_9STRA